MFAVGWVSFWRLILPPSSLLHLHERALLPMPLSGHANTAATVGRCKLWSSAGDVPSLDASIVFISIIVCQWVACVLNLGALLMRRRLSEWSLGLQRFSSFCSYSFSVVR
jgi:hypothetical protein